MLTITFTTWASVAEPGDVPVVGDWNGDGRAKVGLFRQGFFWILDYNGDGVFQQGIDKTYAVGGVAGDVPVVGDWNGSGTTKIGLFREGFFWILDTNGDGIIDNVNQPGGDQAFAFGGIADDVPVVGDWNADGRSKVGVFRSGFLWVLDYNGNLPKSTWTKNALLVEVNRLSVTYFPGPKVRLAPLASAHYCGVAQLV